MGRTVGIGIQDFESTKKRVIEVLMSQFEKYAFLTESDKLSQNEKNI